MTINSSKLAELMVEVANQRFGPETFKRRDLMDVTGFTFLVQCMS